MDSNKNSSTIVCSRIVNETIQYHTEHDGKWIWLLLLDDTKAFDKVSYKVLFDILWEKYVCPRVINLLYYIYSNQLSQVEWGDRKSASFAIYKTRWRYFTVIIQVVYRRTVSLLKQCGIIGCHVGFTYAGVLRYVSDID